jgi:adenylylsulfate kinase-like enzyme
VLLTGRAGAGKQTIGSDVVAELRARGRASALVDRSAVDHHLGPGIEALAWLCALLVESGVVALVSAPVARRDERERLRAGVPALLEVFVDAPPDRCEARAGRADPTYEEPYAPDLRVPTHDRDPRASVAQVLSFLEAQGLVAPDASDRS